MRRPGLREQSEPRFAYLEEHVRAGIRNGEIDRSISPAFAAEFIVGTLRGMMLQRLVRGGEIDGRTMHKQLITIVGRAFAPVKR